MDFLYYLFLIFPITMVIVFIFFRQSLAPGVVFIFNILNLALLILHLYHQNKEFIMANRLVRYLGIFLYVGLILSLIIFPLFLLFNFLYNGVVIIKREGFSPKNMLSIFMPLLVVLYVILWGKFGSSLYNTITGIIYNYFGLILLYLILISTAYFFSSGFNVLHKKPRNLDYIIVLGAGLMGDRVTPLLKGRIDKSIEVFRVNDKAKLIMSGGQGPDEQVSEAQAMFDYAVSRGVDPEDIIMEDKSTNTKENLRFSKRLITIEQPRIAIVSSQYHIFRALLIANEMGIKAIGIGKRTKRYYAINAFIREIIGYIYLYRKKHLSFFSLLSALYLFLVIILNILKLNSITI